MSARSGGKPRNHLLRSEAAPDKGTRGRLRRGLLGIDPPRRSSILIAAAFAVTTALWIAAHRDHIGDTSDFWPWRALSQLTVLWATTLMAIAMLAVVRARALEPIFAGLDRAVRLHRSIGLAALLLLAAHVACLVLMAARRGEAVGDMLVPFWSAEARSIDILVFYALALLGILAYDKRMRYERWLLVHRFIGLLLIAGTIHAATEPGTIHDFEPLRTWVVLLILVGAAAWLYRVFLFNRFGPLHRYRLEQAAVRGQDFVDLVMRPVERRMMYEPGAFVFIRVPSLARHGRELHPFSISSSPVERDLRVSIRMVGDFTRNLPQLAPNTPISVYGPFGGFTLQRFASYRRLVLIGAGIGITPFLGMLAFELSNRDFRRIWLYYVVRDEASAVHDAEIRESYLNAESYIDYYPWLTARDGHITAKAVADQVAPLDDYAVMLCGRSRFVADLARQFRALGIPSSRIITEDLQFR
ncbi:MAG: ferric reductase-like transmembrane domain-containing protein [Alphaproteobacteria bacterium]